MKGIQFLLIQWMLSLHYNSQFSCLCPSIYGPAYVVSIHWKVTLCCLEILCLKAAISKMYLSQNCTFLKNAYT